MPNSRPARNVPVPSERRTLSVETPPPRLRGGVRAVAGRSIVRNKANFRPGAGVSSWRSQVSRALSWVSGSLSSHFSLHTSRENRAKQSQFPRSRAGNADGVEKQSQSFVVCPSGHTLSLAKGHMGKRLTASLRTGPRQTKPIRARANRQGAGGGVQAGRNVAGGGGKSSKSVQNWFDRGNSCAKMRGFYTGTKKRVRL